MSSHMNVKAARRLSGCVSVLALGLAAAPTFAQEAEGEYLGQVVVTASGIATSVQDAPASITVIDAEQIQAQGARDIRDILRKVPGLNVTQGNSGSQGVSFRGMSSARTLMLVDGKRLNSKNSMMRDYQGDFDVVPLDAIERIEVVRGPMSTLYGSDAMGGVINIITKPNENTWGGSVSTDFTFGDHRTTADSEGISGYLTGPLGENLTLSAWAKYSNQDTPDAHTYIDALGVPTEVTGNMGSRTKTIGARLNWTPTDAQEWSLEASRSVDDYLAAAGDPATDEITKDAIAWGNEWRLSNGTLTSSLRVEDSSRQPLETAGAKPTTYKTTTLESRYTTQQQLAGRNLELTFGALGQTEKLHDPNTNTNGVLINGTVDTYALYGEARWNATEDLTITAGARYDHHEKFGGHFTPRIYANYDFGNNLTLKAGYAQAFVAPDMRSLNPAYLITSRGNGCKPYAGPCRIKGNPNLTPETSDNYELGLNFQGENLSWEVTAFYNDVTDMIGARRTGETYTSAGVKGYVYERFNLDAGKTAGIEAGYSWNVNDDLTWSSTMTYLAKSEFKYEGHPTPFPMATTPKWNVTTGVDYQANDKLKLGANATYVGKQAGFILANDLPAADPSTGLNPSVPAGQNSSAYWLVDVSGSYDLTDNSKINFGISNLFDQQPDNEVSYREDGRLFKLGLTTKF